MAIYQDNGTPFDQRFYSWIGGRGDGMDWLYRHTFHEILASRIDYRRHTYDIWTRE